MPSAAQAVLASWSFPPWVTSLNLLAALLYLRGWFSLHRMLPNRFTPARLASFVAGIAVLQIALASPIDAFDPFLLTNHMLQHMLLMMIVPPLLLLGDPVIPLLHGLPRWAARRVAGPILRWRPIVWLGRAVTNPPIALFLVSLAMIGWHLSAPYELALRSPGWHEAEHATFLTTSVVFWWPVVQPWPSRARWNSWMLPVYLLLADFVNSVVCAFLVFSDRVYYPSYQLVPRLAGVSAQNDQVAAGMVMWVIGSIAFLIPAAAITVRLLSPTPPQVGPLPRAPLPEESRTFSYALLGLALAIPTAAACYGLFSPEKVDIDGDIVRTQQVSGPFRISVFTAPDPVEREDFEVAVLVQDENTHSAILDSDVELSVEPAGKSGGDAESVHATREQSQNRLLQAASLDLPDDGEPVLRVTVHRGSDHGQVACPLKVAAPAPSSRSE
ncbi:MAG TPA: cytochrome c oxidase assembly protein [Verrucomicrobiae bacterium]|nr:cytochrome c oxidase assembly protein [Verrucomicrobiae bacterium]